MSEELKTAIYTAVEISVFALLVFIIAFFGGYARDALNVKKSQDASISEINEYRDLYEIDKGNRIDIVSKESDITPAKYKKAKEIHFNGGEYDNEVIIYDKWLDENSSSILTGEDILNYISKKGGKYDVIIALDDSNFSNVFKIEGVMTYTDLLQEYGLGVNEEDNNVFIDDDKKKIRIKPEVQNENLVFFLRECMGGLITSEFYCSSIFDSTDNTYLAEVFKLK